MVSEVLFNNIMILYILTAHGAGKYNKGKNDCLWKQRTHYGLEMMFLKVKYILTSNL